MIDIDNLSLRELQRETARALSVEYLGNNDLVKFNKIAHHNSKLFYQAIILDYIKTWGDFPSKVGPGREINLILDE